MKKARLDSLKNSDYKTSSRKRSRLFRWGMELVQTLFPVLLITFVLLILLETLFKGSVSSYIDLNQLLRVVVAVGVVAVLSTPSRAGSKKMEHLTARNIIMITCAGIGGAAIVWYKTKEMGWLSYVILVVSGLLIVLLLTLIWQGEEVEEIEGEDSQNN